MTNNDSSSKPEISATELQHLLNCLSTASPYQQEKLFHTFTEAFPDFVWSKEYFIEIIKTSITFAQQVIAQEHTPNSPHFSKMAQTKGLNPPPPK